MDLMKSAHLQYIPAFRITGMALLIIGAFACTMLCYLLPEVEKNLFKQRREMVKRLTEPLWSSMQVRQEEVKQGKITLKEARHRTTERFRSLRYGEDKKDYYWIIDTVPRVVMHPYRRDLEGKDVGDYRDPDGNLLFARMVEIALSSKGEGFLEYRWQWKDDPTQIKPKISYVRYFKPWGWIIGTGVYVDDIYNDIVALLSNREIFKV